MKISIFFRCHFFSWWCIFSWSSIIPDCASQWTTTRAAQPCGPGRTDLQYSPQKSPVNPPAISPHGDPGHRRRRAVPGPLHSADLPETSSHLRAQVEAVSLGGGGGVQQGSQGGQGGQYWGCGALSAVAPDQYGGDWAERSGEMFGAGGAFSTLVAAPESSTCTEATPREWRNIVAVCCVRRSEGCGGGYEAGRFYRDFFQPGSRHYHGVCSENYWWES